MGCCKNVASEKTRNRRLYNNRVHLRRRDHPYITYLVDDVVVVADDDGNNDERVCRCRECFDEDNDDDDEVVLILLFDVSEEP